MHKMGISPSAKCFWGCGQTADFIHHFWNCPIVQDFWVNIGSFISSALGPPNTVNPKNCYLGIFGDLTIPSEAKRLLRILYFYARKSLLLTWKASATPTLNLWLTSSCLYTILPLFSERGKNFPQNLGQMAS